MFTRYGVTYKKNEKMGDGEFWEATHETQGVVVRRQVYIPGHFFEFTDTPVNEIIAKFGDD